MEGVFIPEYVLTHTALGSNDKIVMGQLIKLSEANDEEWFEFKEAAAYEVLDCHKFTMLKILKRLDFFNLIELSYTRTKGHRIRLVKVLKEEIKGDLPASFTPKLECNTL